MHGGIREIGKGGSHDGDFDSASAAATKIVKARYWLPYVSHCTLEPQNCVAWVRPDRCEIIAPIQMPARLAHGGTAYRPRPAEHRGAHDATGGGFGRRLTADYVAEAVLVSKAEGAGASALDA